MGREPIDADVVVVGQGVVGLSAALALSVLARGELRLAVVDRGALGGASHPPSPRAVALSKASMRFLAALGVWRDVRPEAEPVQAVEITDTALSAGVRPPLIRFDLVAEPDGALAEPSRWDDGPLWPMAIVPEAALLAGLSAAVSRRPDVCLYGGVDVAGLERTATHATIAARDGRQFRGTLVVAADGRQSAIRTLSGIGTVPFGAALGMAAQTGIVAVIGHDLPHGGVAVQHFLPGGPFAVLPMTGQRSCITWSEEQQQAATYLQAGPELLEQEIARRLGGRLGAFRLLGTPAAWPLERQQARALVAPRVALVGDAARSVHPIAGQGLNLGLGDAAALADVVFEAACLGLDFGSEVMLDRYGRWRRPATTRALAAFEALNGLFSRAGTVERSLRGVGVSLVDRVPAIKSALLHEAQGLSGELPTLMRG